MRNARARRTTTIDGLKVRIIDGPALNDVEFARTLRMLARMLVRRHEANGDQHAITVESRSSSALTDSPVPRPDHGTNNEAA